MDLIIAASALDNNSTLYHIDKHFTIIAKYTKLKEKNMEQFIKN
jgi:predicted nucleic acid-binding protein